MNIYYLASLITSIFFIVKLIQYRQNKDEEKQLAPIFYDCVIVFLSVILGEFLINQLKPVLKEEKPNVFVDNPSF